MEFLAYRLACENKIQEDLESKEAAANRQIAVINISLCNIHLKFD